MNTKALKEQLNELLSQKIELRLANEDMTEIDELINAKREEIRQVEAELKENSVEKTIKQDGGKNMNTELREMIKKGEELADVELRADGDGVHHVMGTMVGGQDLKEQRVETLQQTIQRKMGEDAVLVGLIPFQEQRGKVKIPVSTNKSMAALVSEGEKFPEKGYNLSYKSADLVKFGQMSILTNELVQDSQLALLSFVADETARDFARALEYQFLNGAVAGKLEGVAVAAGAHTVQTAAKGTITVADLKRAYFALPVEVRNANDLIFVTNNAGVMALDMLEDGNGRALLHPGADAQMNGKYFDMLYNARVVEVEVTALPENVFGLFVSPRLACHCGMARQMNIAVDASKRSEYDEQVVISSMRCGFIVKDPDAIAIIKHPAE